MYLRISLLLIGLFLSTLTAFAQTVQISAKVMDTNKQAIEFANVFIQNTNDNASQKGTITDLDGYFELEVAANIQYEIKISFIGFEDWEQTFTPKEAFDFGNIQLQATANELDEILITADRNIITRKEDKLIFNVAASPLKTGYDGLEILQRSPNVLVDTEGNITMRNETPTIMINGRISNLSGADLANYISNLRSENIKNIEIQTHLSANTDAESSGGVINIILKKNPIGFDGNIRSHYTQKRDGYNDAYGGLNWNYGAAKWNIYGLYNYTSRANESQITSTIDYFDRQELVNSNEVYIYQLNRQSAQLGFVANLTPDHVIGIEGYTNQFEYDHENDGLLTIYNQGQQIENGSALVAGLSKGKLYTTTLNYTWTLDTLNSNIKVFADYASQKVDRPSTTVSTYDNDLLTDNTEQNNSIANTFIYSAQADMEKYFKQGFKLETGAKLTYTDRENGLQSNQLINNEWTPTGRTNTFDYLERVTAGYVALNKNLTDDIFLEVGLRVENTDLEKYELQDESSVFQNYTNWFPNAYLSKDLKNDRIISLSYSKRLRRPPFYFLSNNAIKVNDFRYELGNPDLIPENVHNFEISLKDKKQNVNIYLQRTTEAINGIYFLEGQVAYYRKFNEGIQQQLGLSYNRFGNLTKWWYVKARVSIFNRKFINGVGDDSFEQLTYRLNMTNNFKLNPTTSIDLSGNYRSPYADAYYIAYEYFSVNLMFQKFFFDKKLTCRIYINDVFNSLESNSERPFDSFRTIRTERWSSQQIQFWVSYNFNSKNKVNKRKNESKNDTRRRL